MKTKLLIFTAFLSLAFSQLVSAQCATCVTQTTCQGGSCYADNNCGYFSNCICTDPTCYRSGSCLDQRACCEAFGNPGGRIER